MPNKKSIKGSRKVSKKSSKKLSKNNEKYLKGNKKNSKKSKKDITLSSSDEMRDILDTPDNNNQYMQQGMPQMQQMPQMPQMQGMQGMQGAMSPSQVDPMMIQQVAPYNQNNNNNMMNSIPQNLMTPNQMVQGLGNFNHEVPEMNNYMGSQVPLTPSLNGLGNSPMPQMQQMPQMPQMENPMGMPQQHMMPPQNQMGMPQNNMMPVENQMGMPQLQNNMESMNLNPVVDQQPNIQGLLNFAKMN